MRKYITYSPPKSQLWGHRCSKLSAAQVLQRAEQFLGAHAIVDSRETSMPISVSWEHRDSDPLGDPDPLASAIARLSDILGNAPERVDRKPPNGATFHRWAWPLEAAKMPAVADWIDAFAAMQAAKGAAKNTIVQASVAMMFKWQPHFRGDQEEMPESMMLLLHLGTLRAVSTMFAFYSIEHYQRIKTSLAEIGLAKLSDKHVKPKGLIS